MSPDGWVRERPHGPPTHLPEKVLVALAVTSTVGICGLLTVGYPSISDSGGYGGCGFRPEWRAALVCLLLERYVAAPGCADRCALGACRGPSSGKFSGGNRDGVGGLTGTPAAPFETGCVTHPFHDMPSPFPVGDGGRASSGAPR